MNSSWKFQTEHANISPLESRTDSFIQKGNILAKLKTTENEDYVEAYLNKVEDEQKRNDCLAIMELMKQATKKEPKMWGGSIVGVGNYHYKYPTGREGDWFLTGFAPRKKSITHYIMAGFDEYGDLLEKLGKYKTGKSCLYVVLDSTPKCNFEGRKESRAAVRRRA